MLLIRNDSFFRYVLTYSSKINVRFTAVLFYDTIKVLVNDHLANRKSGVNEGRCTFLKTSEDFSRPKAIFEIQSLSSGG